MCLAPSAPRRSRAAAFALVLAVAGAVVPRAAAAGPPWIGVELPANPHDTATRGALAVVRLYHHGTPTPWPLEARAVGTAGGRRRTVALEVRPAGAGAFAVRGALPGGDGWVLVLTMRAGPGVRASALVALDARGEVVGVRVPQERLEHGRWINPREASADEVDAMLRRAVAAAPGPTPQVGAAPAPAPAPAGPVHGAAAAGAVLALLAPLGIGRAGRRAR
jgi:hypothetical protein